MRKLGGRVWRSDRPLLTRCFGLFHLGSYLLHPLLLCAAAHRRAAHAARRRSGGPADGAEPGRRSGRRCSYADAQLRLHRDRWWRNLLYLPILTLLGTGVCLNNTRAVWQGLRTDGGEFLRTPKFRCPGDGDRWQFSRYRLPLESLLLGEIALMVYALALAGYAVSIDKWWSVPFMLLYASGFALVIGVELWQSRAARVRRRRTRRPNTATGMAWNTTKTAFALRNKLAALWDLRVGQVCLPARLLFIVALFLNHCILGESARSPQSEAATPLGATG